MNKQKTIWDRKTLQLVVILIILVNSVIIALDFELQNLAGEAKGGGRGGGGGGGGTTLIDITSKLELLGNPAMSQYPNHPTARISWDMQNYNNKIYIGIGDWVINTGKNVAKPGVWAFDTAAGNFVKEYEILSEAVDMYRVVPAVSYQCFHVNPIVSITPLEKWGLQGEKLVYTINVTNNDNALACAASTFLIAPSLPALFTQTPASSTITLAPGETGTVSVEITSPANASDGFYKFTETAESIDAPAYKAEASAKYNIGNETICYRPPEIVVTPESKSAGPGESINYTLRVYNKDVQPCPSSYFHTNATLPPELNQTPLTKRAILPSPTGYTQGIIKITTDPNTIPGTYEFTNTVVHESRPSATSYDTATLIVESPTGTGLSTSADPVTQTTAEAGSILAIPDIDPLGSQGHVYAFEQGAWRTSGPISEIIHMLDLQTFDGKWFVADNYLVKASRDGGVTWSSVPELTPILAYAFFTLDNKLYVQTHGTLIFEYFVYTGWDSSDPNALPHFQSVEANMMPSNSGFMDRVVYHNDKIVYRADSYDVYDPIKVVMVASTLTDARVSFSKPVSEPMMDFVKGKDKAGADTFYVLTSAKTRGKPGVNFVNKIYASSDLVTWKPVFQFKSGNYVRSFEWHETGFYFTVGDGGASSEQPNTGNVLRLGAANVP